MQYFPHNLKDYMYRSILLKFELTNVTFFENWYHCCKNNFNKNFKWMGQACFDIIETDFKWGHLCSQWLNAPLTRDFFKKHTICNLNPEIEAYQIKYAGASTKIDRERANANNYAIPSVCLTKISIERQCHNGGNYIIA